MRLSFPFLVFVTAMLVVIATPLAYGQTSPLSDGNTTPVAGRPCPQWVHDQYVTTGPDGKMYATWHPPVDPQFGCVFGHEHGADPRTSRANADPPAFGYAAAQMGMVEPHVGYKVFTACGRTPEGTHRCELTSASNPNPAMIAPEIRLTQRK